MTWTLDCGLSLSDELLLAAAPAADRPSTAELARRFASAVRGADHADEARLLSTRALIAEGQLAEAAPELRRLAAAGGSLGVKVDAAHRLMALGLLGAAPGAGPLDAEPAGLEHVGGRRPAARAPGEPADPAALIVWNVQEAERLLLSGAAPEALQDSSAAMGAISADPAMEMFLPGDDASACRESPVQPGLGGTGGPAFGVSR